MSPETTSETFALFDLFHDEKAEIDIMLDEEE